MRFVRALAATWLLLPIAACAGGDLVLPPDASEPDQISATGGDDQIGPVGSELEDPLEVLVVDAEGDPVANVQVAFVLGAASAGGSISPDTVETDDEGRASTTWVLGGTEGEQSVRAEVVGEDLVVTFSAQAERTSVLTLEMVSGDGQTGVAGTVLDDPIVVRLVDEEGDGVSGRAVTWVVTTGGGSVSPGTSDTDGNGLASTSWTLGAQSGENELSAVVSGVGVVSFTATAEGAAGEPSRSRSSVSASPGSIKVGTGVTTITVTVRDTRGDPIAGATVVLSASGEGNVLVQPAAVTGADGVATGTLQSLVPGTKVVSAVVNGAVEINETAEIEVTAELEPDRLVFLVQPTDTEEDRDISPPVEVGVVDALGNPVPVDGIEIELVLLDEHGHFKNDLDGDRTQSTNDGVAVFPGLEVDRDRDDYRLRAFVRDRPDLDSAVSETFDIED